MIDEKQIQAFYDEFYELHLPGGSHAKLVASSVRQVDKLKYFEEDKKAILFLLAALGSWTKPALGSGTKTPIKIIYLSFYCTHSQMVLTDFFLRNKDYLNKTASEMLYPFDLISSKKNILKLSQYLGLFRAYLCCQYYQVFRQFESLAEYIVPNEDSVFIRFYVYIENQLKNSDELSYLFRLLYSSYLPVDRYYQGVSLLQFLQGQTIEGMRQEDVPLDTFRDDLTKANGSLCKITPLITRQRIEEIRGADEPNTHLEYQRLMMRLWQHKEFTSLYQVREKVGVDAVGAILRYYFLNIV